MSAWLTSALITAAEIGLVVSIAFVVLLHLQARSRRLDRARTMQLAKRLKKSANDHESAILRALTEVYGLSETDAGDKAKELIDHEKSLYRKVMGMFLGRDRTGIGRFDDDLRALLRAWRSLSEGDPDAEDGNLPPGSPVRLREENRRLQAQVERLEADLAEALATMENMLAEYASMYEGGHAEGEQRMQDEMARLRKALAANEPATSSPAVEDPLADYEIPELNEVVGKKR